MERDIVNAPNRPESARPQGPAVDDQDEHEHHGSPEPERGPARDVGEEATPEALTDDKHSPEHQAAKLAEMASRRRGDAGYQEWIDKIAATIVEVAGELPDTACRRIGRDLAEANEANTKTQWVESRAEVGSR